jgi:hypothetical protein
MFFGGGIPVSRMGEIVLILKNRLAPLHKRYVLKKPILM